MAKKILVVDDLKQMRDILAYNLRRSGYSVVVAANGIEAIKYASSEKPDLILLDIMMPKMDGYEVIKQLKKAKDTKFIPIIFVTAKAQEDDVKKGMMLGANGYVLKPYRFTDILQRIEGVLQPKAFGDNRDVYT